MITVSFGTRAHATAFTSFAPSFAMPRRSASLPTMKPATFCRNSSGTPRRLQSSMKCVAFSADSENRTPLFARMPIGCSVELARMHRQSSCRSAP